MGRHGQNIALLRPSNDTKVTQPAASSKPAATPDYSHMENLVYKSVEQVLE